MHLSITMMALKVTPPVKEGVEMDGVEGAGGIVVSIRGYFG